VRRSEEPCSDQASSPWEDGLLSDFEDTSELRASRVEAARLVKDAVAGDIATDEARSRWPLAEGIDPSVDALAHIYFGHYARTAKRRTPDEFDVEYLTELAEVMADGDPLDEGYRRQFRSGRGIEFNLVQVFLVVAVIEVAGFPWTASPGS